MEEKKLTDEELLKAMEFCIKKEECSKDCRLFNIQGCMWIMLNQSFELIQRLQNKNKLLNINFKNECEEHKQFVKLAKQIDEEQKAEIERLTEELDFYKGANRELTSTNEILKKYRKQDAKDTAKDILSMFDDRNYISEKDLKKAIAERYGLEVE